MNNGRSISKIAQDKRTGQAIKALRVHYGFPQWELAELTGLTKGAISGIEQAITVLTPRRLRPIAEALDVSVEWLTNPIKPYPVPGLDMTPKTNKVFSADGKAAMAKSAEKARAAKKSKLAEPNKFPNRPIVPNNSIINWPRLKDQCRAALRYFWPPAAITAALAGAFALGWYMAAQQAIAG